MVLYLELALWIIDSQRVFVFDPSSIPGLPPGTKLAQAYKFNDPKHPCKILVSTDAIGMGLNLYV